MSQYEPSPDDPIPKDLYDLVKAIPNYVRDGTDFKCEKEIGRGGFGVVWLGTDLKTGKRVAVKEFLSSKLSRGEMRHYIREIYTLAVAKTKYIVELIGFTVKNPYTIITKYEENGQLSKYLKHRHQDAHLSGSKLTITAICIASALMNFEKLKIIHRDLKSSNILMNEEMLPIICDFGTAKILYPNCPLTRRIGTINYMPPEILATNNYNIKADVYGFGMVIYEMAELKVPYAEFKREELLESLPSHSVSLEFKRSTKEMKNFILACTNFDVDQRPTITECYQTFASGKLAFPGSKKKKVQKMVDIVQKEIDHNWSSSKGPPQVCVNIPQTLQMLEEQRQQETNEPEHTKPFFHSTSEGDISGEDNNQNTFSFQQLENPNQPNYMSLLNSCKSAVKHSTYNEFAYAISKAINSKPPENICLAMYSIILSLIRRHPSLLISLLKYAFFLKLSLETDKMKVLAIDIFGCLFQSHPDQVKISLTQPITTLIQFDPDSMVTLLGAYLDKLPAVDEVYPIINIFNDNIDRILRSKAATTYVECQYFLLQHNSFYKELYLKDQSKILMKCCTSTNEAVVIATLHAIAALLPDPNVNLNYEIIIEIAKNENLRQSLISVLLRIEQYPPSRQIALLLITFSTVSNRSFLSLMNFCSCSNENAEIVANIDTWMNTQLPTVQCTMRLFLLLFNIPKCRSIICNSSKYTDFLKLIVQSKDPVVYCIIPSIIKRSKENRNLVTILHESGFLRIFFDTAIHSKDKKSLSAALVLTDYLSDICYIPEIIAFIPTIKFVLKNFRELTKQAITVLVRLSFLEEAQPYLKPYVQYFESIRDYQNLAQYSAAFLQNLNNRS